MLPFASCFPSLEDHHAIGRSPRRHRRHQRRSSKLSRNIFRRCAAASLLLFVAGCILPYSRETPYPGSGLGKVVSRAQYGGITVSGIEEALFMPTNKSMPFRDPPKIEGSPTRFRYEVQSADGTLHIVSTDDSFPVGSCVSWAGFADGPSRTHWSMGRVEVQRSDMCSSANQ